MQIKNISIVVHDVPVITDVSFTIDPGTTHVLMGPNGSGKSSLACALAGHPEYTITAGTFYLYDKEYTHTSPEVRAQAGLFLACQQAVELPGISVLSLITHAYRTLNKPPRTSQELHDHISWALQKMGLDASFINRSVHVGFSGGEKKRFEMAQALVLQPTFLILDEIDSGLDVGALQLVGAAIELLKKENPSLAVLIITHNPHLLSYIMPDIVHVCIKGSIVASGDMHLAKRIEQEGYRAFAQASL